MYVFYPKCSTWMNYGQNATFEPLIPAASFPLAESYLIREPSSNCLQFANSAGHILSRGHGEHGEEDVLKPWRLLLTFVIPVPL